MNGTFSGIICIVLWPFTAALVLFTGEIPAFLLTSTSFFLSFVFLTFHQGIRKENIKEYWTQDISHYVFVISGVCVYTALLYLSFKWVAIFEANVLNYLWPLLLVLFSELLHEKKLTFNRIFGILLGFVGIVVLFLPREGQPFFADFEWGHLFALGAAVVWALYSVFAQKKHYPQGIMAPVFLFSGLICLGFHLVFEQTIWPQGWEWVAVIALGLMRILYSFWDYGMKHGNVVLLASLSYFIPLISICSLIVIGVGPKDALVGWSAGLIIIGCLLVNASQILKALQGKREKL